MKESLKRFLTKRFPKAWLYRSILFGSDSYLTTSGWRETVSRGRPCKPDGTPLPWMNFSIIRFLEERLNKQLRVFEFGSGSSTLFLADLAGSVVAVEDDPTWFEFVRRQLPDNIEILLRPSDIDGDYCRAVTISGKRFDVIVVDGRDRVNSFIQGIECLSDSGVMIVDDSNRERYQPTLEAARELGFRHLHFYGLKPQGISEERSTLFYRDGNCLGV